MPVVKKWHDDSRMIIIGDAAHATSPAAGPGASMSLEDAVILAQCIRDCPDYPDRVRDLPSPFARRASNASVADGHKSSADKAAGPILRVIRDAILPGKFRAAAKDGGQSMMWLQGDDIDFEQRITPVAIP